MTTPLPESVPYRILVYGMENKGLPIPPQDLVRGKYLVRFAKIGCSARFQEFDGVMVFQGTFDSFEWINRGYSTYLGNN
jgi:hypothetical protein